MPIEKTILPVWLMDPASFTYQHDLRLASGLAERGWETGVIASQTSPVPFFSATHRFAPFYGKLSAHVLRSLAHMSSIRRFLKLVLYIPGLIHTFRRLKGEKPGILHVQWPMVPLLDRYFWRKLRERSWRIVLTLHDPQPLAGNMPAFLIRSQIRLARVADAVIVHDRLALRHLISRQVPRDLLHVVPLGPPLLAEPMDINEARAGGRGSKRPPSVLFFGYVKPYKGLEILIRAMKIVHEKIPEAQLVIAGECQDSQKHYRSLLSSLNLDRQTTWMDYHIPESEVPRLFASADVVALPYLSASSSGVVLTAFALGGPVVASKVGGIPETVQDNESGLLVQPGDPEDLARAIQRILNDSELGQRLALEGRRRVETINSWERIAQATEEIYLDLVKSDRTGSVTAGSSSGR